MGHARRSGAYRDPARRAAATGASPVAGATHGRARARAGKGERRPEGAATHGDRKRFAARYARKWVNFLRNSKENRTFSLRATRANGSIS